MFPQLLSVRWLDCIPLCECEHQQASMAGFEEAERKDETWRLDTAQHETKFLTSFAKFWRSNRKQALREGQGLTLIEPPWIRCERSSKEAMCILWAQDLWHSCSVANGAHGRKHKVASVGSMHTIMFYCPRTRFYAVWCLMASPCWRCCAVTETSFGALGNQFNTSVSGRSWRIVSHVQSPCRILCS